MVNLGVAKGNISGLGISTDMYALEAYVGFSQIKNIKEKNCECQ